MELVDGGVLVAVAVLAMLMAGALAPIEALGWWAGWFGRRNDERPAVPSSPEARPQAERFVVFLSGIHSVEGRAFARREVVLLERLRQRLTDTPVLEVFPYSTTNNALTGERAFARFWRWALRMKLSKRALSNTAGMVINLRNLWQVAVSADRRYGPIYNHGSAELITEALLAAGYMPGSATPVTLIGYSGGGQIAVGAAGHLDDILGTPVTVVALGGVMAADPGLLDVTHLYHLVGARDGVQRLGVVLFFGRWGVLPYSPWSQARSRGRITVVPMGSMRHTGPQGYLSGSARLPDGRSHLEATVDVIAAAIEGGAPVAAAAGRTRAA